MCHLYTTSVSSVFQIVSLIEHILLSIGMECHLSYHEIDWKMSGSRTTTVASLTVVSAYLLSLSPIRAVIQRNVTDRFGLTSWQFSLLLDIVCDYINHTYIDFNAVNESEQTTADEVMSHGYGLFTPSITSWIVWKKITLVND